MELRVWPGRPYPLGATYDGSGTNFSLFSEVAESVVLCLFDVEGNETQVELPEVSSYCWHGYFPDVEPGQRYGYRVHGPWDPGHGLRCCPSKLLLDPYGKALDGMVTWDPALLAYQPEDRDGPCSTSDSAPLMPRNVVINPFFDWQGDHRPDVRLYESIIYEMHVKGFTMRHPDVPEELRGTYLGMVKPGPINHLRALGITAVELLPVHQFIHDGHLVEKGLHNYWGYNTIGYFAPHNEYATHGQPGLAVQEFRQMVRLLHAEGIEVILDVVYNHTAEGNHLGPNLSFRGIDNAAYYHLNPDDPRYYMDYTGTGNTLNMGHPNVLQMVMDSLRYWVIEMHVDGFRFDLALALARELHEVRRLSAFFDLVHQDPTISQVKLIAEPWDVGDGGYQVGRFPPLWSEWNGKYRDSVRDYWRGEPCALCEMARRFTGSADLYETTGRRPHASVNIVTVHDGFTLHDLVTYNDKHNEANGENNEDGADDNRSWNHGVEGETDDPAINALRARQVRNIFATLLLSQGVPMMLGGDEIGRTQGGNNNAYSQDNEISWYDWENADEELGMRFQQLTSAAMAKGVEDTAYYIYNRLVSLNEVGGDPERFGVLPEAFHRFCAYLQQRWPETMVTTSTHDTKRGEDVRARINLLSEIPRRWREAVWRWSEMNDPLRREGMPDRNTEYLLYQTLVGAWPIDAKRLQQYALKAAREAKQHTAWTRPNAAYEEVLVAWINRVLQNAAFVADLESFLAPLIEPGRVNGLAQTLVKYTAPGVPDLYQGTELWDLSLVDPDNQRPVDYDRRRAMLEELERMSLEEALARSEEAFIKMLVIRRALQVRRLHPECFGAEGAYRPLAADGERAEHVVAFARGEGVVTVVPRLVLGLAGRWGDTVLELPPGRWANAFTGEEASGAVRLDEALRRFPVALLTRLEGGAGVVA